MKSSSNVILLSEKSAGARYDGTRLCGPEPAANANLSAGSDQSPPAVTGSFFRSVLSGPAGWKAMIARFVRTQRLIALPPHSSLSEGSYGFHEDDPLCSQRSTRAARGSAFIAPQLCGRFTVHQRFDADGMADWLRRRFPQSTGYNVEAVTGIASATVENWLIRRSQPSAAHFASLLQAFGPSFLEACMRNPPGWVVTAAKGERSRQIDEDIARLLRERDALGARQP